MQIIDLIIRSNNADNSSGCQLMSDPHVEKDLNRNEYLILNLKKKHLINCHFSHNIIKHVSSLICLTGYVNLYRELQHISAKSNEYSCNLEKNGRL